MVAIVGGNGLGILNSSGAILGASGVQGIATTGGNKETAYLNIFNGDLSLQDSDDFLASHGVNVELTRTYNSQGTLSDFGARNSGASWLYGMSRKITVLNYPAIALNAVGSQITLTAADGSISTFVYSAANQYLSNDGAGSFKHITYNATTQEWTLGIVDNNTTAAITYEVYDANGRLVRAFDRDLGGNETVRQRYIYDNSGGVNQGKLIQVTDASGASGVAGTSTADSTGLKNSSGVYLANDQTHFDYDPATGNLLRIRSVLTDGSTFTRTRYGYDDQNRLKSVTVDLSPADGQITDGNVYTTTYEYDAVSKGISKISQSDGSALNFSYALVGSTYRVSSFSDALGHTTSVDYSVDKKPVVTDALGNKTTYTFDAKGNLTQIDGPKVNGASQITKFSYDTLGNLTDTTNPAGAVLLFDTTAYPGVPRASMDALGVYTLNLTDNDPKSLSYGKLLTEFRNTQFDPDGWGVGQPAGGAFYNNHYVYNAAGKLHYQSNAVGGLIEYIYNATGEVSSEIHYNAAAIGYSSTDASITALLAGTTVDKTNISRIDYLYDGRGLLTKATRYAQTNAQMVGIADGSEGYTDYVYDQAGHLLLTHDGSGVPTVYTYDGLGRVLTVTDANSTVVRTVYEKANITVTTTANGAAAPSSTVSYVRDSAGQLLSVQQQIGTLIGTTSYAYDVDGQLRMSTDAAGRKTYWLYDEAGRRVAQIDHTGLLTEYTYSKTNQQTKVTRYATAVNTTGLIDAQGLPEVVTLNTLRPATSAADRSNWNDYDAVGELIATVDADGYLTRYTYDAMYRVVKLTYRANPIDTSKLDGLDIAASYAGEANTAQDRVVRKLYTGIYLTGELDGLGFLTEYKYDASGRLIDTITYDSPSPAAALAAGDLTALRPTPASTNDRHVRNLYNGRDELIATIDADNYVTEFRYDTAGNLSYRRSYYNAAKTPTAKTIALLGADISPLDRVTTYAYTVLNQLRSETSLSGAYTKYSYDFNGKVTSVEHGTAGVAEMISTARYDGAGRLIGQLNDEGVAKLAALVALGANPAAAAIAAIWAVHAQTYTYNNAGQLTGMTDVLGNATLYYYDSMGRLSHTINALGEVQEQRYNQFSQVIKTIQYANRLSATVLSSLHGGQANDLLANALLSLSNISLDRQAIFYYGNDGRLAYSIDAAGDVKAVDYNAFGQVKYTMLYAGRLDAALMSQLTGGLLGAQLGGSADGAAKALTALLANVTGSARNVFYYDTDGHLTYTVDALGDVSAHLYNVDGKLSAGTTIQYGQRLSPSALVGAQSEITIFAAANASNTSNQVRQYLYGRRGLVTDIADAQTGGNHTLNAYNGFGELTKQIQLATANSIGAAPNSDIAVQSIYDIDGRVRATVDATGAVTAYLYDSIGNLVDQIRYANLLTGYRTSTDIAATYDAAVAAGSLSDPARDARQRFVYANGKLVATLTARLVSATMNAQGVIEYASTWAVVTQSYDATGRVQSRTGYAKLMSYAGLAPDKVSTLAWANAQASLNLVQPTNTDVAYNNSTRMVYDAAGRMIATATAQKHADGTIYWSVAKQDYDGTGNVVRRTAFATAIQGVQPGDADILAAPASLADAVTQYVYDGQGRVVMTATAMGPSAAQPGVQQWALSSNRYDSAGNLVAQTRYATAYPSSSPPDALAAAVVNAALDRTSYFSYDALNRLSFSVDAGGAVSQLVYDVRGNIVQRIDYAQLAATPDAVNAATFGLVANPADHVTRTVYDIQDRPIYSIDALGDVTEYRYDVLGNVSAKIGYAGPIKPTDLSGLSPAATPAQVKGLVPPTAGADRGERYVYDQDGRLRYTIDSAGYLKETVYNALGRVVETHDFLQPTNFPDPVATASIDAESLRQLANASVMVNKYTYDASGNLVSATDSQPATEYYSYDGLGRKITFANKSGAVWSYEYNAAGNLILETSPRVAVFGPNFGITMGKWSDGEMQSMLTRMDYDALGNLVRRSEGAATGSRRLTEYRYDNMGRQTQTILEPLGIYDDAADPKLSEGTSDTYEKSSGPRITSVAYDAFGNAISNTDVGGQISYKVYDKLGRVIYDVDALGYATGYQHDAFGNVTALTRYNAQVLPLAGGKTPPAAGEAAMGLAVGAVADAKNDRTIVTGYDLLNRVVKVTESVVAVYDSHSTTGSPSLYAGKTAETFYNGFGEVREQQIYGANATGARVTDAATTRYFYDTAGRKLQQQSLLSSTTGYITTFSYTYDTVTNTNRVTRNDYFALANVSAGAVTAGTANLPVTPVVNAQNGNADRATVSVYDKIGQLIQTISSNAAYVEAGVQKLGTVITSYGYDVLGSQNAVTDAMGGTVYTYFDALGRTIGVAKTQTLVNADAADGGSPLTEFKLDIFGNAVLRVDYAAGAEGHPTAASATAKDRYDQNNRVTTTQYDNDGHAIAVRDAQQFFDQSNGSLIHTAYDVYGRVAKQWRTVTSDGKQQTTFQITRYDVLGRVSEVETPGNENLIDGGTAQRNHRTTTYNSFGEATATYLSSGNAAVVNPTAGQQLGYARYDQAGHAWLSGGSDGIDKVTLFDALGNATAQIISTSKSDQHRLRTLDSTAELAEAPDLQRTDMRYDLLGHLVDNSVPYDVLSGAVYVMQQTANGWQKVELRADQVLGNQLIVVAPISEQGKNISIVVTLPGSATPVTLPASSLQVCGDYLAFSYASAGSYDYKVFATPTGEAKYQIGAGRITAPGTPLQRLNREIIELYLMINNRAPLATELNRLAAEVTAGASLEAIALELLNTPEGMTALQGGSLAFLTRLHDQILNLPANAAAVSEWQRRFDEAGGDKRGLTLLNILYSDGNKLARRADALVNYFVVNGGSNAASAAALLVHADNVNDIAIVIAEGTAMATLEKQQAQVIRLYVTIFGRLPDGPGLDLWVQALQRGMSIAELADGLFASQEGQLLYPPLAAASAGDAATQASAQQFGDAIISNLLGRPAQLVEWKRMGLYLYLSTPMSRGTVTAMLLAKQSFALSELDMQVIRDKVAIGLAYLALPPSAADPVAEHAMRYEIIAAMNAAPDRSQALNQALAILQTRAVSQAPNPSTINGTTPTPLEDMRLTVTRLYVALLGRAPDRVGLDFQIGMLTATPPKTMEQIANGILNSVEATSNAALYPAGLADADFIKRIYNIAFGVLPDSGALGHFQQELRLETRGKVVLDLLDAIVSGVYTAGIGTLPLFNNKVAVGLTFAMNMGSNNMADDTKILSLVTATDTTAAINFALSVTGPLAAAASAAVAANLAEAITLNTAVTTAQQNSAAAAAAATTAATAANASPLALATLRAARLYAAVLNHGRTGMPIPLDINEVAIMARAMVAGTSDAGAIAILMGSADGQLMYPAGVATGDFMTRMYLQVLGIQAPAAKLALWTAQLAQGGTLSNVVSLMIADMLSGPVDAGDPQAEATWNGRVAFDKNIYAGLTAMTSAAATAVTTATAAQTAFNNAGSVTKASTAATSAQAVLAALSSAAVNTGYVIDAASLYVGILNRGPGTGQLPIDIDGMNFYISCRTQGISVNSIAEFMLASPEGLAMYGALSGSAFLDKIFTQVYGRPPAASDSSWLTQLQTSSRGQVAAGIITAMMTQSLPLSADYTSKSNFDQKIATALAPLVNTAGPAGSAAQQNITSTLALKQAAEQSVQQKAAALDAANKLTVAGDPTVIAAQQAQAAGLYYLGAPQALAAQLNDMLVGFNMPTTLAATNAWLAALVAGTATLDSIAGVAMNVDSHTLDDPAAFVRNLYLTILHREPEPGAVAFWLPKIADYASAAAFAKAFYFAGCHAELYVPYTGPDHDYLVRTNFNDEVGAAATATRGAAQTLINSYNNAVLAAGAKIPLQQAQARQDYSNAQADLIKRTDEWNRAVAIAPVAPKTLAAVNSAIAVQNKAVTADKDKAISVAANALVATAAATAGLPPTALAADFAAALANANAFKTALALEVTQSSKLADVDVAAAAVAHLNAGYANATPRAIQILQITQMHVMLLGRIPTLLETNEALGMLANGRDLAGQAALIMAANPTVYTAALTNDGFVNKLYTNATGHAPTTAQLRLWSDKLIVAGGPSRGQLMRDLTTELTRTSLSADTLVFNGRVGPGLTTLLAQATADAKTPSVANFVTANAYVARDAALLADAAVVAAQTPTSLYANELVQLYVALLGHAPDTTGLLANIALRRGGTALATIAQTLLTSGEGQLRFPAAQINGDYVKAVFLLGLGRAADATELSAWTAKLGTPTNMTRAQLATAVVADLYAYSGGDGVKLSARVNFMGRVTVAMARPDSEARGAANAVAVMQSILAMPVLTQYTSIVTIASLPGATVAATAFDTAPRYTVDRWGNVLTVSDARDPNWKISYQYNYDNQQISQTANALTGSNTVAVARTAYDALGRVAIATDFNGNSTRYGYDSNGNNNLEVHADTGRVAYGYNLFGERYTTITQRGFGQSDLQTNYVYDHLGHMLESSTESAVASYAPVSAGGRDMAIKYFNEKLIQRYTYDELGRNTIRFDGENAATVTFYDLDGNIISTRNANGVLNLASYDALRHQTAVQTVATVAGKPTLWGAVMRWNVDAHGQLSAVTDLAGAVTAYTYDAAGRKLSQYTQRTADTAQDLAYRYENGLLVEIRDKTLRMTTRYSYDLNGNRLTERQLYDDGVAAPVQRQNNVLTYDEQNRLKTIQDDVYRLTYDYDANGNRTHVFTQYDELIDIIQERQPYDPDAPLPAPGSPVLVNRSFDSYNSYDNMNRQLVVNGDWIDGHAVYGNSGHEITYDLAGNRLSDTFKGTAIVQNGYSYSTVTAVRTQETYTYDAAGRLGSTQRDGVTINTRRYDRAGRLTVSGILSGDARAGLTGAVEAVGGSSQTHIYAYNGLGQLVEQRDEAYTTNAPGKGNLIQNIWFGNEGYDMYGNLVHYALSPAGTAPNNNFYYAINYVYMNGAYRESSVTVKGKTNYSAYDVNGNRAGVYESGSAKEVASYRYDADGHIQSKKDAAGEHFYMIVNGQVLGEETKTADNVLGSNYSGVTSAALAAPPASYSVQGGGETLQSIAQAVWGDSKLWYLIADANALNSGDTLEVGRILRIPTRVNTIHNDYATYQPYNAGDAIGNVGPTLPAPGHGGGCGAIGTLIMVVVAIAVTYFTAGAASSSIYAALSSGGTLTAATAASAAGISSIVAGAAVGGAVGSIASQVVGNAIGAQDGFSWRAVGQAALMSAVTAGVGEYTGAGQFADVRDMSWSSVAGRAALSNTISQGLGNITGLQHGFSWASVAASYAGAAVGSQVGAYLDANNVFSSFSSQSAAMLARNTVSGLSAGLTTALARGGKIAAVQIATDAFGNALGSSLADSINSGGRTLPPRPISDFTSIGAVDSSGPPVDIPGLLAGLPPVATDLAGALKEFEPSFLDRNASALAAQQVAADNAAQFAGIAGAYGRFGEAYSDALTKNVPAAPSFTIRDGNNPLGLELFGTPPLLLNKFGALDTRPPVGEQLVPINDSVDQSYLRTGNRLTTIMLAGFPGAALPGAVATWSGQSESQIQAANEVGGAISGVEMALSGMPTRGSVSIYPSINWEQGPIPTIGEGVRVNLAISEAARVSSNFDVSKVGLPSREWPPFPGTIGQIEGDFTLLPGAMVDRFGPPQGRFLSPVGTSYSQRALKPGSFANDYYMYEVVAPLTLKAGEIRPWFGEMGYGTQYRLDAVDGVRRSPSTLTSGDTPYLKEIYRGKYENRTR